MLVLLLGLLAAGPAIVRLEPANHPHFFDGGEVEPLRRNLRAQLDWYTGLERDAAWLLGEETLTAHRLQRTCLELLRLIERDTIGSLNSFVRRRCDVYAVAAGPDTGRARFTGYHNPVVRARLAPDSVYRWPLYLAAVLRALTSYACPRVRITAGSETWTQPVLLLAAANGRCYGGGMKIAPGADRA